VPVMVLHPFANIIPLAGVELNSSPAINVWMQSYDPAHRWWLSTFWAGLPLVVLLVAMIGLRVKGHISALIALAVALVIAVAVFHMPAHLAAISTVLGAGYGLSPRVSR
jgi:lactate permease